MLRKSLLEDQPSLPVFFIGMKNLILSELGTPLNVPISQNVKLDSLTSPRTYDDIILGKSIDLTLFLKFV